MKRISPTFALMGLALVAVGSPLAVPTEPAASAPVHAVVDERSAQHQLCEVAKLGAADALERLDAEQHRRWQHRVRASCLAAVAP